MIQINKKREIKKSVAKTKKEAEEIFNLPVSEGCDSDKAYIFSTDDIKLWKTHFYRERRENQPEKKFSFRQSKEDKKVYFVWRIK